MHQEHVGAQSLRLLIKAIEAGCLTDDELDELLAGVPVASDRKRTAVALFGAGWITEDQLALRFYIDQSLAGA